MSTPGMLSIIVPALNEEANVVQAVHSALAGPPCEVIVVDGGSTDATAARAAQAGAQVVRSGRGRGLQMNAGAAAARGDVLLFLHADSLLPPGYHDLLWSELQPAAASGSGRGGGAPPPAPGLWGCFATIHPTGLAALPRALLSAGVALRTRLLHRPYGDQGIFVSADAFRALGGYHELPLLEDVELCSRLRGAAGAPCIVPAAIATSGRRWRALGLLRTTLINQAILLGYALGVDVAVLADWYRTGAPGGAKPAALLAAKA